MNIFVMSDPHGNLRILKEILKEVNKGDYDLFLGLGDFVSKDFFSKLVTGLEVRKKAFIRGNRDYGLKDLPYLKKEEVFTFEGIKFIMIGSYNFPNIKQKILDECEGFKGNEIIMASHEPPKRLRDEIHSGARIGVQEFREIIKEKQPLAWLCGHIHEAEGVSTLGKTKVINASVSKELIGYKISVEDNKLKEVKRLER